MERLHFTSFKKTIYIGLFEEVLNSQVLIERIQNAAKLEAPEGEHERERVNYAFIDARLVGTYIQL